MNACVVDASVAIKWVVNEAGTAEALALTNKKLVAPALWRAECANILWKKVRRGELIRQEAELAAALIAHFPVDVATDDPELLRVLELALALDHPAYDCVYLALAEARGVPLVTADRRLVQLGQLHSAPGGILRRIQVLSLIGDSHGSGEKAAI